MRFLALVLSFILSTFVASVFITFVLFLGSNLGWLDTDPLALLGAIGFATASWFAIAQMAFIPSLIVIPFLELTRSSGLTINLLAGGAIAFVAIVMGPLGAGEESSLPKNQYQE